MQRLLNMSEWIEGLRASTNRVRADWRRGRHFGYPRCCVAMYCWDQLWSVPPSLTRMVAQGVEPTGSTCDWVPCGIFHHGGSPLSAAERVRRVAGFWWHSLRGSRATQARARAPWEPQRPAESAIAAGLLEQAWAELDGQAREAELDWT